MKNKKLLFTIFICIIVIAGIILGIIFIPKTNNKENEIIDDSEEYEEPTFNIYHQFEPDSA